MKIKLRSLLLLPLDMIFIVLAYLLGMLIRHDGTIPRDLFELYFNKNFIIITLIYILVFTAFEMYNMLLEHVGFNDSVRMFCANVVAIILVTLYNYILQFLPRLPILPDGTRVRLPITVIIIAGLLILGFSIGIRIAPRGIKVIAAYFGRNIMDPCRVLIYGAGNAGAMLCKDLKRNPSLNYRVICYYDDEPKKVGNRLNGLRIYGGNLKYITEKFCINEIIIAVPSADSDDMVKIIAQCNETGCKLKTIPALYDLVIDEEVTFDKVRNVDTNDLLGRSESKLDIEGISQYLSGETVLVTGGGGSIGSELCRQILKFGPKKLVIFDIYENNVYDLINELKHNFGDIIPIVPYIGSVQDYNRLMYVFKEEVPDIVFHAAAHKHVPLMEGSPSEAVKNNIFGTLNVVDVAHECKVKKFVLISTDKAVNPTNVMGATKRIAEMILQAYSQKSTTIFVAVRFGNVLGSNGSVVPLFKNQIAYGGPVTVMHPEITRYFMTIPEASSLVIQAGAMAKGGEIYILDMGKPIKISDLARNMIKLSGLEPDVDIKIVYTGLRPGEKLYEELMQSEEGTAETSQKGIFIAKQDSQNFDNMMNILQDFRESLKNGNDETVIECLKRNVPTYHPHREDLFQSEQRVVNE